MNVLNFCSVLAALCIVSCVNNSTPIKLGESKGKLIKLKGEPSKKYEFQVFPPFPNGVETWKYTDLNGRIET